MYYDKLAIHDKMLESLIIYLKKEGFHYIKIDHLPGNYERPEKINGRIPDATATSKNNIACVFEVETAESLLLEETVKQLKDFSTHCEQFHKALVIVVPIGYKRNAESVCHKNRIKYNVIWEL